MSTSIPKIFLAGGAVGFAYYAVMRQYWFPDPRKTVETKNVEDRFAAGGGSTTHQPARGTKHGDPNDNTSDGGDRGVSTEHFKKNVSDQHPESSGVWPGKFYEQQYGNPKGK